MWHKQYLVRQELSELTLVELVGYEDDEARSPTSVSSWVVHMVGGSVKDSIDYIFKKIDTLTKEEEEK